VVATIFSCIAFASFAPPLSGRAPMHVDRLLGAYWVGRSGFGFRCIQIHQIGRRLANTQVSAYEITTFAVADGRMTALPMPTWAHATREAAKDIQPRRIGERWFGWPWPCLSYRWVYLRSTTSLQVIGGWPLTGGSVEVAGLPRWVLPLRVRPWAFAGNAIFFGSLVCLCASLASAARIRYRIQRFRCPACNYDMSGNTGICPECGWSPV
jgi:hypothetical protein